ncbi:unnamed protein product [Urochloa humidicola]
MFDEMPSKKPRPRSAGDTSGGGALASLADRLSALPDEVLHRVMSFLRAWEVARTCVLSRRWRHLWASAPCIDLRVWRLGRHGAPPERFAKFVYCFLLERDASAPVDTLRVLSSPDHGRADDAHHRLFWSPTSEDEREDYTSGDVEIWIRAAIKRRARVIQLAGHPLDEAFSNMERISVISCHLEHLKLSGCWFWGEKLSQICSQCTSLQVLDLKNCLLGGGGPALEISSASLKSLTIIECRITADLTIAAPNLVSLHCVTPHHQAPSFENMGSLATATVVLDDSFLHVGYEYKYKDIHEDALDEDSDSDCSLEDDPRCCSDSCSDASTCEYSDILTENEDEQCDDHDQDQDHCKHCKCNDAPHWIKRGYGRRNRFGVDKILGGNNVLRSLSNATSLELLADAGEVILNRELKTCQVFSNLKTLSLGEWCMTDDFDPLVSFLQSSPHLESLFLELKLYDDSKAAIEDTTRPMGRSFACTHLKMVKIKCSKYDTRVHLLAELFRANGVPVEKIYVRQQSTCHYIKPW